MAIFALNYCTMKDNNLIYISSAVLALLCSCQSDRSRQVTISGVVNDAEGTELILEHLGSGRPTALDTVKLAADGKFSFTATREAGPDFFNLRLGDQMISLVTDTLGTPLHITTNGARFATDYVVEGSDQNMRLKEAAQEVSRLRRQIADVAAAYNRHDVDAETFRDSVYNVVDRYKKQALTTYIYVNPTDPVAYYLLFQTVGGVALFDPYNTDDNRAYGAIATGWKYNYSASPRCTHLEKLTMEGRAARLQAARQAQVADSLVQSKVSERNYFDLTLPNNLDQQISLSSLVDAGKVVVLDFTAYSLPASVGHNMKLAELYRQYGSDGLAIYQICLDQDVNFWKTSADNVSWTVVRDPEVRFNNGQVYSYPASLYNVQQLPMSYIFNRAGEIASRADDDAALESAVRKQF